MSTPKVWWHGCWGEPGHYLYDVNGRSGRGMIPCQIRPTGSIYEAPYLDGGLAPRRLRDRYYPPLPFPEPADRIVWARLGGDSWQQRYEIESVSDECPQGEFLVHAIGECTIAA